MSELSYRNIENAVTEAYDGIFLDREVSRFLYNSHIPDYVFPEHPDLNFEYFDYTVFSKVRTGERNVPGKVRDRFKERNTALQHVAKSLNDSLLADDFGFIQNRLRSDLLELVEKDDCTLDAEKKEMFRELAKTKPLSGFMAELLIHVMIHVSPIKKRNSTDGKEFSTTMFIPPSSHLEKNEWFEEENNVLKHIRDRYNFRKKTLQKQTLFGMGGVGKTRTAIEYAIKYENDYGVVCVLDASSNKNLVESICNFFRPTRYIGKKDPEYVVAQKFIQWCKNHEKWLIIFDNVERFDEILPFIPTKGAGHLLFTTRDSHSGYGNRMEIDVFSESHAVSFLKNRTGILDDDSTVKTLAKRLGYLPLALEQAGAFVFEKPDVGFSEYVELLDKYGLEMFVQKKNVRNYDKTVLTTWLISMEQIESESANQLLAMRSGFAGKYGDMALMAHYARFLPEPLQTDIADTRERLEIISELTRYSLIKYDKGRVLMHPLLAEVVREHYSKDVKWIEKCVSFVVRYAKEGVAESLKEGMRMPDRDSFIESLLDKSPLGWVGKLVAPHRFVSCFEPYTWMTLYGSFFLAIGILQVENERCEFPEFDFYFCDDEDD